MSFDDSYTLDKKLQSGSYGTVYVTTKKNNGQDYAVKVIDRTKFKKKEKDDNAVYREISIMKELKGYEGIIGLIDFFEQPQLFHVVLELAKGGDVFDKLGKQTTYTEEDARELSRILLIAMNTMHSKEIVHRDIKLENLLLMGQAENSTDVKVADFGFAKKIPEQGYLKTRCGTPAFVAPEILVGAKYGCGVDMWSVGVTLFMLLGGYPPFQDENHRRLFRKIRAGDYVFHEKYWKDVSVEAKQLIGNLLTVNPEFRITAEQALSSEWMSIPSRELSQHSLDASLNKIQEFDPKHKLKGAVHAMRWATSAKFWNADAVAFTKQVTKWDSFFAKGKLPISSEFTKDATLLMGPSMKRIVFKDVYDLGNKIRTGSMGTVTECVHKETGEVYAVKIIKREGLGPTGDEDVMNEVAILQSLKHDNVVQLVDFYEEPDYFYMVMEYMKGGDVFDRVVEKKNYTEKDAKDLMECLLRTVDYLHSNGVAHRDLKPQNLLLKSQDDDADIKVADFGFAKRVHVPRSLTSRCGTPSYVAPEILKNIPHGMACDMWSVGVIMYVLLVGYPPFAADSQLELFQQIRRGEFEFIEEDWKHISKEAQELIRGLLQVEPKERLTATAALRSKWITGDDSRLSSNDLSMSRDSLKKKRERFKGLASAVRWFTKSSQSPPVKVEKLAPIAGSEVFDIPPYLPSIEVEKESSFEPKIEEIV